MATLGRRPSGWDAGWGTIVAGTMRGTVLGSLNAAAWVTKVGIRAGKATGTNGLVALGFYNVSGGSLTTKITETGDKTVSAYMVDRTGGTDITWAMTDFPLTAGQTLGAVARGKTAEITFGQDNSGYPMHKKSGSTFPSPFAATSVDPEGKMSIWAEVVTNRAPNPPRAIAPVAGGITSDPTPVVKVGFSDPDEAYGDYFGKYLIEVWNAANTVRLQTSGVTTTTIGERTAGQVSWTVPGTLTAGTYTLRAYAYDAFGVRSRVTQWTFTYNAGGVIQGLHAIYSRQDGTDETGSAVYNETTPEGYGEWTHTSGLDTAEIAARIINYDTEAVVRAEKSAARVEAPNTGIDFGVAFTGALNLGTDWTALPAGATRYAWEVKATDELGSETGWFRSNPFVINATPVATPVSPADGASVASYPELRVQVTDASDAYGSHAVTFHVSADSFATDTTVEGIHQGSGIYAATLSVTEFPALGDYEWYAVAEDRWGLSATGATRTIHFVTAPAITDVSPAEAETITTGTPTVTATVDRTVASQRVTIYSGGALYYDSGTVAGAGTTVSQAVPPATLPNATDYDLAIWVQTSDGLEATASSTFRVEYVPPAAMTGFTAEAAAASVFDLAPSAQTPNIDLHWDAVDTATVADEDWIGYLVERSGDGRLRQWTITDRDQTALTDTDPTADVAYTYTVQYQSYINDGLDQIDSEAAEASATPVIRHATITSESAADAAVTLHFWRDRSARRVTGRSYVEVLGQAAPDEWSSPLNYAEIEIEGTAIDAPDNSYTARDIIAALEALAGPLIETDAAGRTTYTPRVLTWRDPTGRVLPFSISDLEITDQHARARVGYRLRGRQIHRTTGPQPRTTPVSLYGVAVYG